MDPECRIGNGKKGEVEQLFAEPFVMEILMSLLEEGGQTRSEIQRGVCEGKSPKEALKLLEEKGLFTAEGLTVNLTPKGREIAEVVDSLEEMFLIEDRGRMSSRLNVEG